MRTLGRDISWAYAVSLSRVLSWVVVYGTVYRSAGPEPAALLALVRWTLALLNYASAGLAPAILHHAAKAQGTRPSSPSPGTPGEASGIGDCPRAGRGEGPLSTPNSTVLSYEPITPHSSFITPTSVFHTGITLSLCFSTLGLIALWTWTLTQGRARHVVPLVGLFGTGILVRLAADAWGAVLQSQGHLRRDYQSLTALEFLWTILATATLLLRDQLGISWQTAVGGSYLVAALLTTATRALLAHRILRLLTPSSPHPLISFDKDLAKPLLSFGLLVVLAQVADYLYAPTDLLLIRWLIDLPTVNVYAVAIQIDAGIFLLVSGLASALLPLSASAFGRGDLPQVRRYYVKGTLISLALLTAVSVLAYLAAPLIFKLWLGNKMTASRRILPLILIHTVLGGTAAVGRSVLLAIGRVRAFTTAVLLAGIANVLLSYIFVKYFGLGLVGIVLGTLVVAIARTILWQPWYVLHCLRGSEKS